MAYFLKSRKVSVLVLQQMLLLQRNYKQLSNNKMEIQVAINSVSKHQYLQRMLAVGQDISYVKYMFSWMKAIDSVSFFYLFRKSAILFYLIFISRSVNNKWSDSKGWPSRCLVIVNGSRTRLIKSHTTTHCSLNEGSRVLRYQYIIHCNWFERYRWTLTNKTASVTHTFNSFIFSF